MKHKLFCWILILFLCSCSAIEARDLGENPSGEVSLEEFVLGKWQGTKNVAGNITYYEVEFTNYDSLIISIKHPGEKWTDAKYEYHFTDKPELVKNMKFEHHIDYETQEYLGESWLLAENFRLKNEWEVARKGDNLLIGFYDIEYFIVFERRNE